MVSGPPVKPSPLALASLEECLLRRRSGRTFCPDPLREDELARLCWAGQGITSPDGGRTAPSAGGIHPLELYAVTQSGVLHYEPGEDRLVPVLPGDRRPALCSAAGGQDVIGLAAATLVLVAAGGVMEPRYGQRSRRYELIEAGHVAQNVLLAAAALGICAVPVGAFDDLAVGEALFLPDDRIPVYLVALGHARGEAG